LLVTPSADFFAEPHIDGLMGYAKVFHEAGISWTLSSYASEAANFGMFIGSTRTCAGSPSASARPPWSWASSASSSASAAMPGASPTASWNTLAGPFDFLDPRYPVPQHICEFTHDLIQEGKLKFDKSQNDHMVLTFHDSCNVARASRMGDKPGGQFIIPREIIKACCNNYYDMPPDTIHDAPTAAAVAAVC
jgi:hypothetical protein